MSFDQNIVFDGNDLSPLLMVTDVARQVMPKRRMTQTQVPGMDGALLSAVELEPLEVTVKGVILRRSMEGVSDARRALARLLASGQPAPLLLPDEAGTYLMALYQGGAEPSALMGNPEVELAFLCPDPVAYGEHREQQVSGTQYVDAGGTYPASPVVTAKPSGGYYQITNVATGEYVRVDASFNGSQTLDLDFAMGRCTVNGADVRVDVSSDYFKLDGLQQIKVTAASTLKWDERWL